MRSERERPTRQLSCDGARLRGQDPQSVARRSVGVNSMASGVSLDGVHQVATLAKSPSRPLRNGNWSSIATLRERDPQANVVGIVPTDEIPCNASPPRPRYQAVRIRV